jgi:hypothetical protein
MTARHRLANRRAIETVAIEHEDQRYKIGLGRELICVERGRLGPIAEVCLNAQIQYGCPPADIAHAMKRNPDGSPASPLGRAAAFLIEQPTQQGE